MEVVVEMVEVERDIDTSRMCPRMCTHQCAHRNYIHRWWNPRCHSQGRALHNHSHIRHRPHNSPSNKSTRSAQHRRRLHGDKGVAVLPKILRFLKLPTEPDFRAFGHKVSSEVSTFETLRVQFER